MHDDEVDRLLCDVLQQPLQARSVGRARALAGIDELLDDASTELLGATAKGQFKRQVTLWAQKLEVPVQMVTVRPLRTKWASWSTAGNLTFDSQLLDLSSELQRLVIVHELLNYSIPNHGKL